MKWYQKPGHLISSIADDTLKRDKDNVRRWSKTALTMFSAWILVCYSYIHHLITEGFDMPSFLVMVGVATGVKTADAVSKAINKKNNSQ